MIILFFEERDAFKKWMKSLKQATGCYDIADFYNLTNHHDHFTDVPQYSLHPELGPNE